MALVDVVDGRMDVERVQRAHAADAEQELLADAVLAVAAVERVRHPRDVEEVERHRADVVAPDRGPDELAAEVDFDVDRLAVEAERLRVELLVLLGLAGLLGDALDEVPAAVAEAD